MSGNVKECSMMAIACHGNGPSDADALVVFYAKDGTAILVRITEIAELLDSSHWWSVERHEPARR